MTSSPRTLIEEEQKKKIILAEPQGPTTTQNIGKEITYLARPIIIKSPLLLYVA